MQLNYELANVLGSLLLWYPLLLLALILEAMIGGCMQVINYYMGMLQERENRINPGVVFASPWIDLDVKCLEQNKKYDEYKMIWEKTANLLHSIWKRLFCVMLDRLLTAGLPRYHFLNTFFMNKMKSDEGTYRFSNVQKWTRSSRLRPYTILECQKIFVPIHQVCKHVRTRCVELFDETSWCNMNTMDLRIENVPRFEWFSGYAICPHNRESTGCWVLWTYLRKVASFTTLWAVLTVGLWWDPLKPLFVTT